MHKFYNVNAKVLFYKRENKYDQLLHLFMVAALTLESKCMFLLYATGFVEAVRIDISLAYRYSQYDSYQKQLLA